MTAYQITEIMEGVIQRGTANVLADLRKPIAGKTGTTNDEKDAWFIGFTPNLVAGVYMGYDKPRHLGRDATGGHLSAPIAKDFFKAALADKPPMPFPPPRGIKLILVDARTGQRAGPGATSVIREAFKPGTAPPENNAIAAMGGSETIGVSPEADGAVRRGGLY
jgi:penicillin-binding protein 1A